MGLGFRASGSNGSKSLGCDVANLLLTTPRWPALNPPRSIAGPPCLLTTKETVSLSPKAL